ncbi:MAG: TIGR01777 family oxidoreductase, partial [Bacteroidota bacterium]
FDVLGWNSLVDFLGFIYHYIIMKNIVIAGGTGFIGRLLTGEFIKKGYHVTILSRRHHQNKEAISYVKWDGVEEGAWCSVLENAEGLINLNGKSVNCRYNKANKEAIYDTRISATNVLGKAVGQCRNPPKVWINASSATIYEHSLDTPMTEKSPITATDFSVDVCKKWESSFHQFDLPEVRKVVLRIAIVLGRDGGALPVLKKLAQYGLGGKQGSGRQMVSWIHEEDLISIFDFCLQNRLVTGTWNVSAPNPVCNHDFMAAVRKYMEVPFGIPSPEILLKLGAGVIGTESELVLKSRFVIPAKLMETSFSFQYDCIDAALADLC